jgi:hypothetical protein
MATVIGAVYITIRVNKATVRADEDVLSPVAYHVPVTVEDDYRMLRPVKDIHLIPPVHAETANIPKRPPGGQLGPRGDQFIGIIATAV